MKKKLKILGIVIIILSIVSGVIYHFWKVNQFEEEVEQNNTAFQATVKFYSDSLTNVQEVVNRLGDTITFVKEQKMSYEALVHAGLIREDELKNKLLKSVNTITKLNEEIKVIGVEGTYQEPENQKIDSCDCIAFPLRMNFTDKYYQVGVTARSSTPLLDSLKFFNYPNITVGFQKLPGIKNMFKSKYPVASYTNDNPYASLNDMIHVKVTTQDKWYETTWFKFTFGFVVGFGTSTAIK